MRLVSYFKIGLVLVMVGSIWIGILFSMTAKNSNSFLLDKSESESISLNLHGPGLGFYVISINGYSENALIAKVLDSHGNYYDVKKITNKVTVNYFQFDQTGKFILEVTNISDKPLRLTAELGDTKVHEITIPSVIVLMGAILLTFSGYRKLRNYITAQPDEKSS
ncbi:MAG: hypothetical protein E6K91_03595 [Thaumarchaeota archaeon]|nr:MAG: hypothetical protein E6K91_03595 [Nitrososphaerota archaeon]